MVSCEDTSFYREGPTKLLRGEKKISFTRVVLEQRRSRVARGGGAAEAVAVASGSSGCHCVGAAKAVANAKACGCSSCCDGCTAVQHGSHPALAASSLHFVFAHQRLFSPRQPEDMVAPQRRHGSPDGDGRRSPLVYVVGMGSSGLEREAGWRDPIAFHEKQARTGSRDDRS